jgi:hypothetical protein
MFSPSAVNPSAPKSAPFISSIEAISTPFFDEMRSTDPTTKGVIGAIIATLSVAAVDTGHALLAANCSAMFKPGAVAAATTYFSTAVTDPLTEEDHLRALVAANMDSCAQWVCDLVNASKKKELTGENVEGYFATLGRSSVKGGPVAVVINRMADFLPDNIRETAFREGLTQSKWTEYHTSRVSTGKVISKFLHVFIDIGIVVDGGIIHAAILTCAENSHNVALSAAIPDRIIGYASLYLEVCGTPITNWRQGKRCQEALPNAKVQSIKSIFKKYNELIYNVPGIESSTDIDSLRAGITDGFW